jgi:hypothetical protein
VELGLDFSGFPTYRELRLDRCCYHARGHAHPEV